MESVAASAWSVDRPGAGRALDALCVAPWVSLEFDPAGRVYACCASHLYPVGRIGEDRLGDLWSGPRIQVLREAMMRWDSSVACATCRWHLEHGRMDPDAAVYDRFDVGTEPPSGPSTMTFALSNRCNLACSMCSPELSSTLRHRAGLPPLPNPYDDLFFADLEPMLSTLKYAKFLGGEPFLIPEHQRVWEMMERVGTPTRIHVTTNGTIWNDRVVWLLETFSVDITISVDGATASTYESIRAGSNFDQVRRNIERFAKSCAAAGTELRLCFCLMPQNAHELRDVLDWGDRLGAPVSINLVTDEGFSLHHEPLDRLEALAERWSESATPSGPNRVVWDVQVHQLDQVLRERRAGAPTAPRRAVAPPTDFLSSALTEVRPAATPDVLDTERERLIAWSTGRDLGEMTLGSDGRIVDVVDSCPTLCIDGSAVGRPLDELVGAMAELQERDAWLVDQVAISPDVVVRTLVLSNQDPVRGATGLIVRFVVVGGDSGATVLVGEDSTYDRTIAGGAVTPVRIPRRRPED